MRTKPRTRIDKLSDAEKAAMPAWAEKWIKWGLSTEPADHRRVERGLRAAYRFAGKPEPKTIVWVDSPAIMVVAGPVAALTIELGRGKERAVDSAVGSAVGSAVDSAVGSAVDSAVDSARTSDDPAIRSGYLDAIQQWYAAYLGGRFWPGWGWGWGLAYLTFFRDVARLQMTEDVTARLAAYEDLMGAGWMWFHPDFVIVCETPAQIHREAPRGTQQRRLHSTSGPAISWRDGTALWFIHGANVPQQVVEAPETLTIEQIKGETNAEVRRVMIDRYGAAKYITAIGATIVAEDEYGKLLRADVGDAEPYCFVQVLNSTPEPDGSIKTYTLRVPPSMKTCREGLAWTFEMPEAEMYAPAIQT